MAKARLESWAVSEAFWERVEPLIPPARDSVLVPTLPSFILGMRMLGHALYLEAEAAGVRAAGIGCYLDDEMHRLLGIDDDRWQSLYLFTVGGLIDDTHLITLPPYAFQP